MKIQTAPLLRSVPYPLKQLLINENLPDKLVVLRAGKLKSSRGTQQALCGGGGFTVEKVTEAEASPPLSSASPRLLSLRR